MKKAISRSKIALLRAQRRGRHRYRPRVRANLGDSGRQGASTITQQYVRNSLAERGYLEGDADQVSAATEQTTERKLREIKYALALEKPSRKTKSSPAT